MTILRLQVSKAYDPGGKSFAFRLQTSDARFSTGGHTLQDLVDRIIEKWREVRGVDLEIEFDVPNTIEWPYEDSLPRRYAPLSSAEQEELFELMAQRKEQFA